MTIVMPVGEIVLSDRPGTTSNRHADPRHLPTASFFGHQKQRRSGNSEIPAKAVFCQPISHLTTASHWSDDRVTADEFNSDPAKKLRCPVVRWGNAGFAKEIVREMRRETVMLPAVISVVRQFLMGGEHQSFIPPGPDTTRKSSAKRRAEMVLRTAPEEGQTLSARKNRFLLLQFNAVRRNAALR